MVENEGLFGKLRAVSDITVLPNCYQLVKKRALTESVAIGELRKACYIIDYYGEVLGFSVSGKEDFPVVNNGFLALLQKIFGFEIELDDRNLIFPSEELTECNYILVDERTLFEGHGIFTVYDRKEPGYLFYQLTSTEENVTKCFEEDGYKNRIPLKELDGIYVPFEMNCNGRFSIPVYDSGLCNTYKLPVLCGAAFTIDGSEKDIHLSTYNDKLFLALLKWRRIRHEPGSVISERWDDLAALLELMDCTGLPFT